MGKIRIKALGDEDKEKKQQERDEARRSGKKIAKLKGKGGGRIVEMEGEPILEVVTDEKVASTVKNKRIKPKVRSRQYIKVRALIDKTKTYSFNQALELVKKTNLSKFDPTIEVHINTLEKGIKGNVVLPHDLGKELKVAVVTDQLLEEIEAGKINFDVLISQPSFMPKLAKLAKILGPKGLMPNPKNGTISENPEEAVKKFSGTLQFKTEGDFPIIHSVLGKGSFAEKKLAENFQALINAIGVVKIKSVYLKATMSPSVRVEI